MIKSPRVVDVESTPLSPLQITVPGDDTTPAGHRYASTYGNDFRQECEWSEKHELQLLHLMATAKPLKQREQVGTKIVTKTIAMVPAEAIAVFLQSVPREEAEADDVKLYFSDDVGFFNVVTDDGRQRRLDARVGNDRLLWIADVFVKPCWAEEKDAALRSEKLRKRLSVYGGAYVDEDGDTQPAATFSSAADPATLPPGFEHGPRRWSDGDVLAPWLTRSYVDELLRQPWFDDDGDPILLALRLDVRGEDVDLQDSVILLNNIRGKEASVPTPLAVKAKQYQALLTAVDPATGKFKYTAYSLAQELKCSPDSVRNVVFYCEIIDDVRDAIDRNNSGDEGAKVSLSLAVTRKECICYGFNGAGDRSLLSRMQQQQIWDKLVAAFGVEVRESGIPDNSITRAMLRKIKAEVLVGTAYEVGAKPSKERKSVVASREAAERIGVDTGALDDMSKPLSRVAKEAAADEDGADGDADSSRKPAKKGKSDDNYSTTTPQKSGKLSIRSNLAVKATQLKMQLGDFDSSDRDPDEDGLVLAVADAVAAVYEGADMHIAFVKFPVLLEALGLAKKAAKRESAKTTPKPDKASAKGTERLKEIVALAVEAWEEDPDANRVGTSSQAIESMVKDIEGHISDAAGEDAAAEVLVDAAKLLGKATADFDMTPRSATLGNHIREYLYPAE